MRKILTILTLSFLLISSACNSHEKANPDIDIAKAEPKQVIEYFNKSWIKKYGGDPYSVMSTEMKTRTFGPTDDLKKVEIISCKEIENYEIPKIIPELKFIRAYEVKCRDEYTKETSESHKMYFVGRNSEDEPWLIYDIDTEM